MRTLDETKWVVVRSERIRETLAVVHTPGKKELEPFKSFADQHGLPFKVHEHPQEFGPAEVHLNEADAWVCLEGDVEFLVGGSLEGETSFLVRGGVTNRNEIRGRTITGAETVHLKAGDHLFIPAGVPHQHRGIGQARSFIYKIPMRQ